MRRALAPVALAALWIALSATGANAHALLTASTPEDGALLEASPPEVTAVFTEPADLGLSEIVVLDADGTPVETGELRRVDGAKHLGVDLPDLADGVYTASWRVLSTVDGHVTAGSFSFGVGVEAAAVQAASGSSGPAEIEVPPPTAASVLGRWGFYWGLAVLLGAAVGGGLVFRARPRGLGPLSGAGWIVAAAGLLAMLLAEAGDVGVSAAALIGSDRGEVLLWRAAALGAAGIAAIVTVRRPGRAAYAALAAATAGAMLVHAYAGHAGAAQSLRGAKVAVQWVHLLAVGVWVGGLAWLLAGIWGRLPEERRPAIARYSRLAVYALATVAVTGAMRALNEVGSLGALLGDGYGLSAAGKTVLFAGMLALGAYNRFRVVPAAATEGRRVGVLRRTVGGELVLAAGIFGLTGIMAGLVPPAQIEAAAVAAAPERVVVEGSDFGTTVRARLTATPGTPGVNDFRVRLEGFDSGEPLGTDRVRLRFSLPGRADVRTSELELEPGAPGVWTASGTNLSLPGTWSVGILIEAGVDSLQINLELETRTEDLGVEVIPGGPGIPDIFNIQLAEGPSVQGYADPGSAGGNEIHFTFFDETGRELPIEVTSIAASIDGGTPVEIEPRKLSPGHYIGSTDLAPGSWSFSVEAVTQAGTVLTATFEEEIQ